MELVVINRYRIMCVHMEDPVPQCYEWQKSSTNMRGGATDLKEKLYNVVLVILW